MHLDPQGYIDVSTVDADTSKKISDAVHQAGGLFLEAPVSGSKGPAEQGKLIFLAAGTSILHTLILRHSPFAFYPILAFLIPYVTLLYFFIPHITLLQIFDPTHHLFVFSRG